MKPIKLKTYDRAFRLGDEVRFRSRAVVPHKDANGREDMDRELYASGRAKVVAVDDKTVDITFDDGRKFLKVSKRDVGIWNLGTVTI